MRSPDPLGCRSGRWRHSSPRTERRRRPRRPHRTRRPLALHAPRPASTPVVARSAPATTRATGPGPSSPARASSPRRSWAVTRPSTPARRTRYFYARGPRRPAALALQDRRDHRLGRRPRPRRHRHVRLRRRARLPPAQPPGRPQPPSAGDLALTRQPPAGPGPARELVGGQRDDGPGRRALRRQHRRRRVRDQPERAPALALSRPATRSGRTRRSATTGASTSARSTCRIYALDSRGRLRWKRPTGGFVTSSPAIGLGGTVYVGSLRRRPARARPEDRRRPLELHHRRPRLRLARAGRAERLHRVRRRLGLRLRPARRRCAGATTRATRFAPRPCSAAPRRRRAHPLRGLGQRRALRARRPHRPAPLVLRHHPARPGAARPQ